MKYGLKEAWNETSAKSNDYLKKTIQYTWSHGSGYKRLERTYI